MDEEKVSILGAFVTEKQVFDMSRKYVDRMYAKGHDRSKEAFSLNLSRAELQIMLGLMEEGDSIVAFNGLHSERNGTWHTFTVVVLDENNKVRPVTLGYPGAQRWEPGKTIEDVVGEGTLKGGACCKIREYFKLIGFDESNIRCAEPEGPCPE